MNSAQEESKTVCAETKETKQKREHQINTINIIEIFLAKDPQTVKISSEGSHVQDEAKNTEITQISLTEALADRVV